MNCHTIQRRDRKRRKEKKRSAIRVYKQKKKKDPRSLFVVDAAIDVVVVVAIDVVLLLHLYIMKKAVRSKEQEGIASRQILTTEHWRFVKWMCAKETRESDRRNKKNESNLFPKSFLMFTISIIIIYYSKRFRIPK
jgi:hypothetical protein